MFQKKYSLLIALLVLAIFAVGSVSAADNITTDSDVPADDIAVDDVSADLSDENGKVLEQTRASHNVDNSMNQSTIDAEISAASADSTNHVVDFTYGTYSGYYFTVQDNVVLDGHGSTVIGDGTNDIFLVTGKSNFTIKNFIVNINKTTKGHGVYGHHVYNSIITNNTFFNGEDAINIYQIHENLTITDNTIYNVSQDGISLVNFQNYMSDDAGFAGFKGSIISGNVITGCQYGMFFGGNFKGTITGNNMANCEYGMQFNGKKLASNGRLNATISNNYITGANVGIDMNNPGVDYLNITYNTIRTVNRTSDYAIANNTYFNKTSNGFISITNNILRGRINQSFINKTDIFTDNSGYIPV